MPDPKPGESKDDFMHRCIPMVMDDGTAKDNDQAVAICMAKFEKGPPDGKAISKRPDVNPKEGASEYGNVTFADPVNKKYPIDTEEHIRAAWSYIGQEKNQAQYSPAEVDAIKRRIVAAWKKVIDPEGPPGAKSVEPEEIKLGSRHSHSDQNHLNQAIDHLVQAGGDHPAMHPAPASEIIEFALMSADNALLSFGTEVKALGDGKVAGYLVRFSDENTPDLTGDFFTKDTDFGDIDHADVYYSHGMDAKIGKRKLGKGELRPDDVGMWIETQLSMRDEYEKAIYDLAEKGKLGWSSGTASHLVEREPTGKANFIKSWPLGLDASLTPTPAEPRNSVVTLKSYMQQISAEPPKAEGAGDAPPSDGAAPIKSVPQEIKKMELTQEQLDAMLATAGTKGAEAALKNLPSINAAGVQVVHDEGDTPFQRMGDELLAVKAASLSQRNEIHPRLKALSLKALGSNELIGSEGGFLLEPTFAAVILTPLHDTGPFSSRVTPIPTGINSNSLTIRAVDETDRASGSRWGGILGYRLAEAGTKLPSYPSFRLTELRFKKYAVLCYATDELLQDLTALAGIIQQGCGEELDFMVNDDILNGTGAAGPLGIINSGALVSVSKETGQKADTLYTENIIKMWARLHPRSKPNSVWYINGDVTPQLYTTSLAVGTGGQPMFMGPGSLPNSPSGTLLGRPIVETEFNATLGDKGDILLADMSQYAFINRDVQSASSIHVEFLTDQTVYRFVYRCDGQPKAAKPLTPYKGTSNTLSAFVTLNERA